MQNTDVFFIELAVSNKAKYVCDIVEVFYNSKIPVDIYCAQKKDAVLLNQLLWSWKQDSFIPHALVDEREDEPVVLHSGDISESGNGALVLFDSLDSEIFSKYKEVVDFAELYDKERLLASRARFKEIRDGGRYKIEFLKLGAFLQKQF